MRTVLFAVATLVLAAPAVAQTQTGSGGSVATGQSNIPQSTGEGGVNAQGERLKCRRIEVESSSRMSLRRVCMSAREWREHERGSR